MPEPTHGLGGHTQSLVQHGGESLPGEERGWEPSDRPAAGGSPGPPVSPQDSLPSAPVWCSPAHTWGREGRQAPENLLATEDAGSASTGKVHRAAKSLNRVSPGFAV